MTKDWAAVAAAINTRLAELDMTQQELATRSGVSPAAVRQIQRNYPARRRNPRTLAALSEALRWPSTYLAEVSEGLVSGIANGPSGSDQVTLESLRDELRELRERLDAVERITKSGSESAGEAPVSS